MQVRTQRSVFWGIIGAIVLFALILAFWPRAVVVDMLTLSRGHLAVSVTDEAKTRVHDIYTLSAPVTGHLRRIEAEVGDPVILSKTVVAQIEPVDPEFLDPRSEAQAKADIQAAESALEVAQAEVNQAEAELEFALAELTRMRELRLTNNVSQRDLDDAERVYKTRRASLATAQAALQMRKFELERVKASLLSPTVTQAAHGVCECLNITAPVNGSVLKILNKSEGVVDAGTPLLEIGDPQNLEVVVELLSSDAVRVERGQKAYIKNWGGEGSLEGIVSLVEPIGFTKISALGIEEQRVNVIVDFVSPYAEWQRLGHGYQLDVSIVLSEGDNILKLPLTAMFRDGEQWTVFAVKNGRAEKRKIKVGRKNTFEVEVLAGIEEGERVVLHPSDKVQDGVRLASRSEFTAG